MQDTCRDTVTMEREPELARAVSNSVISRPRVTLTIQITPFSTFGIAFHIFVVSGDRDFKFGA